jgi:RHO1 GDP-GTP exchange protein 1/2
MTQVIQGSNLRLLFAENPPSVTNHGTGMYNQGYEYNPYNPYAGGPQGYMGNNAYNRNSQGYGRDEIILVSDDRVLALRTDPGAQMQMQMQAT